MKQCILKKSVAVVSSGRLAAGRSRVAPKNKSAQRVRRIWSSPDRSKLEKLGSARCVKLNTSRTAEEKAQKEKQATNGKMKENETREDRGRCVRERREMVWVAAYKESRNMPPPSKISLPRVQGDVTRAILFSHLVPGRQGWTALGCAGRCRTLPKTLDSNLHLWSGF